MKKRLLALLALFPLCVTALGNPDSTPPAVSGAPKPAVEAAKAPAPAADAPVYVFPLKSPVTEATVPLMRRALKEAERAGAAAFIIDMDTPGGRLDSTEEILEMLGRTQVPTITFVNPSAGSAGALISLGTKTIYMRPDAVIGAAAVVAGMGGEIPDTMKLKLNSFHGAKMRAVAEQNGHNPELAEAFMVKESELKMGDVVIDSKETLLSLTGREAATLYDGKPLLAAGLAEDLPALLRAANLGNTLVTVEPTGFERIAVWIALLSPLLMIGGIVGAYIEFKTPGFGIPGIISIVCFALFFFGHAVAGFAGYETVFVFILGLVLVVIEVFVIPGTIVAGLAGMLLMLGSLLWAMMDRWPSSGGLPSAAELQTPMLNLLISIAGTAIVLALLAKILPKTALYNRLVLSSTSAEGPAVSIPVVNLMVKAGDTGTAATTLRPAGKAEFAGEMHDVVTTGDFIPAGSRVKVVGTDGMRVVVERA